MQRFPGFGFLEAICSNGSLRKILTAFYNGRRDGRTLQRVGLATVKVDL
ncbi:anion-transporting ATPase [Prevotella nigrescens ATCC 33563]|nr:anion-transporting ATPase [Prevotella nigrescens ATCC 33563]